MKKLYSMFLAAALLVGIASVKAQNRCTLTDNKTFVSEMLAPEGYTVHKINDQQIVATSQPKQNLVLTEGKSVYTLTIAPDGEWERIVINNDDGFEDYCFSPDIYQQEVSEGLYDILVIGRGENEYAYLIYDQFEVSSDTIFTPSFSEAVNFISFDIRDENDVPINELPISGGLLSIYTDFVMSHCSFAFHWSSYVTEPHLPFRFNNFGDRSTIYNAVEFTAPGQKNYLIQLRTIANGMNGNITLRNNPEELVVHEEYYNINSTDNALFGNAFYRFGPKPNQYPLISQCVFTNDSYNPAEPLKLITNVTNSDEPLAEDSPNMKFMVQSIAFESFNPNGFSWFQSFLDVIAPFPMALNQQGQMIREPYLPFLSSSVGLVFPFNGYSPALYVFDPTKPLVFGNRTPLLYYHPIIFDAENSPWGITCFGGIAGFLGEGGTQRLKDQDNTLRITYNGETYFEDSLYLANRVFLNIVEAGVVAYDILNDNVVVDGVSKTNITHIEFDMNRNDVYPPILNLLQVRDANEEEVITVEDLELTRIYFAGGDFYANEMPTLVYDGEAIIEVFYKTENTEYQSLEFEEKPEMFHVNYGNYYEIPLSQLVGSVLNQWVTVKFVLSDMAGNSQTQELFNLFYVDDQTSISENQGLQHSVYPNPFTSEVKITAAQAVEGEANIAVYNILGEQVYSKTQNCAETKEFTIDGSAWKAGIYFYSISTEDGLLQGKIVKE